MTGGIDPTLAFDVQAVHLLHDDDAGHPFLPRLGEGEPEQAIAIGRHDGGESAPMGPPPLHDLDVEPDILDGSPLCVHDPPHDGGMGLVHRDVDGDLGAGSSGTPRAGVSRLRDLVFEHGRDQGEVETDEGEDGPAALQGCAHVRHAAEPQTPYLLQVGFVRYADTQLDEPRLEGLALAIDRGDDDSPRGREHEADGLRLRLPGIHFHRGTVLQRKAEGHDPGGVLEATLVRYQQIQVLERRTPQVVGPPFELRGPREPHNHGDSGHRTTRTVDDDDPHRLDGGDLDAQRILALTGRHVEAPEISLRGRHHGVPRLPDPRDPIVIRSVSLAVAQERLPDVAHAMKTHGKTHGLLPRQGLPIQHQDHGAGNRLSRPLVHDEDAPSVQSGFLEDWAAVLGNDGVRLLIA
jgi:hypothetical protein